MGDARPLSAECRLVFLAAGPRTDEVAALARADLDWERVVQLAEREKAVSGVWRALGAAQSVLPPDLAEHFRRGSMVSDFRMLHLEQRLRHTLRVLREHNVEVMLLKGAAHAATVYPSFVDRPMIDVDMLVRPRDTAAACRAMYSAGWLKTSDMALTELLQGHHHLPPFVDPANTGLKVELHTSMMPEDHPFRLSDDDVWAAAGRAGEAFSNVAVPSPAHLVYHACVHFAWAHTMQFGAWRTFRDIAAMLRTSSVDWQAFTEFARRTRCATACYWTFRLARRMAHVPIPDDVMRELSVPLPEAVRRAVERHFIVYIAPGEGPLSPSVSVSRGLWRMAIRPRWSGHGDAQPWIGSRNWVFRRTGAVPAALPKRLATQIGKVREWWDYLAGTVAPK